MDLVVKFLLYGPEIFNFAKGSRLVIPWVNLGETNTELFWRPSI